MDRAGAGFAARHRFAIYYGLAHLVALLVMVAFFAWSSADPAVSTLLARLFPWLAAHQRYVNVPSIIGFAAQIHPAAFLILVFAVAPTLSAIAVSAWIGGGALGRLLARIKPWPDQAARPRAVRAYAGLAALHAVGLAVYGAALFRFASADDIGRTLATLGGTAPFIALTLLMGPFLDEGGLLEELGWRGFAWPWLQARLRVPLLAAVWLGVLWMAWHLPRELPTLLAGPDWGKWLGQQARFAVLTVALSVIAGYFVNMTGGSVLPAVIVHGATNVWSKAITPAEIASGIDLRAWVVIPVALAIAVFAGRRLGQAP